MNPAKIRWRCTKILNKLMPCFFLRNPVIVSPCTCAEWRHITAAMISGNLVDDPFRLCTFSIPSDIELRDHSLLFYHLTELCTTHQLLVQSSWILCKLSTDSLELTKPFCLQIISYSTLTRRPRWTNQRRAVSVVQFYPQKRLMQCSKCSDKFPLLCNFVKHLQLSLTTLISTLGGW